MGRGRGGGGNLDAQMVDSGTCGFGKKLRRGCGENDASKVMWNCTVIKKRGIIP